MHTSHHDRLAICLSCSTFIVIGYYSQSTASASRTAPILHSYRSNADIYFTAPQLYADVIYCQYQKL
jgi:hypothetical protein